MTREHIKKAAVVLAVLVWVCAIYVPAMNGPFIFDDRFYVERNPAIKHLDRLGSVFQENVTPLRFLPFLSFTLNFYYHQLDTFGYHVANLLIHLINGGLVYWLCRLLLRTPRIQQQPQEKNFSFFPACVALIFLVHPIQTQAVSYISQRFTSMVALFYLLTVCLYLQFRLDDKIHFLILAAASAVAAMFSKQTAITLPIMILTMEWLLFKFNRKKAVFIVLLFFLIALIIPFFHHFNVRNILTIEQASGSHLGDHLTPKRYLLTQFRVIGTYLRLIVYPFGQNFLYDFPASYSFWEGKVVLSAALLFTLLLGAVYFRRRSPLISFGIFWFFIALSVESSIITIGHVIFEHRLYFPSVGLLIVLIVLFKNLFFRHRVFLPVFLCVLLGLSLLTYQRNKVWANKVVFWKDVVEKSPDLLKPHLNLGVAYLDVGEKAKALAHYAQAQALDPSDERIYNNRGVVYMREGRFKEALAQFNKAIELNGRYLNALHNRATLYSKMKHYVEAKKDITAALEINPSHTESYNELGSIYVFLGQPEEALKAYSKAILFDPANVKAYNNRGVVYNMLGEHLIAVRDFKSAIRLRPGFSEAYYNLSYAYYKLGKKEKARMNVQKAKDLGYNISSDYYEMLKEDK